MKKSLIVLLAIALAFCFAAGTLAAPLLSDGNAGEGSAPEEIINAKELMSAAVRLHSTLNDTELSTEYNLDTYYSYALNNGIFADGVYTSEDQIPTRAQVVTALYNAANGKIDLTAINNVLDILDGDVSADYYEKARSFMNAGIIYGYDDYGSFRPANSVKRYELGLMVDRLLNPEERVTKDYVVYSSDEPFYLIDDFLHDLGARGWKTGASGWRIDYTGSKEIGTINNYANILRDYAVDDDMSTTRLIHTQDSGELVFEAVYKVQAGDTVHFGFYDADGNEIAVTGWQKGYAYIGDKANTTSVKLDDKEEPMQSPDVNQFNHYLSLKARIRVILDLDEGKYKVWMGSSYIGEASLTGTNLAKVKIYTGLAELSTVEVNNTHLFKNYKVNDVFRLENQYEAPVGYEVQGDVTVERFLANANNTGEVNSMKMVVSSGNTNAKRTFDKATGKVIMEAYVLLDDGSTAIDVVNSAYFTVKCADTAVVTVKNTGNKWYANGTELTLTTTGNEFTSNVWQWIRIEADTATQKALIKINGKVVGEDIPFLVKVDGFDSLEVGVDATSADTIYFDDIEVYETFVDYYNTDSDPNNDYVPEPVPLDTGDYILNMSVCNLWRNGSHYGWDWIRPFAELEPAIGYYDEGNPEAMDWEIKYLVEHGIKNYMTCWYPHSGGAPVKKPRMVDALHDGYFNAKYSDMMSFSLMFENSGYISDAQREDFVNNTFPLWMDWYFSDPRYFRITEDGKEYIFLTIYQYIYFLDMCSDLDLLEYDENNNLYFKDQYKPSGSTPNSTVLAEAKDDVVEMLQWMEQQIIDAGYADGLIVVYGGSTQSDAAYKTMANMGGDGIILYAWGKTACDVSVQQGLVTTHTAAAKNQGIDLLTLATPGFNDIGWTSERPGYMSSDDFETMVSWHKSQMASNYGSSADSWKSKLITFDTWNEFGEGHYLFPTKDKELDENGNIISNNIITGDNVYGQLGYGGFGYLDAIAEVFGGVERGSAAGEANNTYPTAIQRARVGTIYPETIDHYIRRDMIEEVEISDSLINVGGYASFSNNSAITSYSNICGSTSSWHSHGSWLSSCSKPSYNSSKKCLYGTLTANNSSIMHIGGTAITDGVNMDKVSYIHLKLGTSTGGGTGKIYFKNTTDTSQYDGFAETRTFTFTTYVDGSEQCDYYIDVRGHDGWTGTLAGIRLDVYDESGEKVYLYALEFLAEDDAARKPSISVDNQTYECKDYSEIRSYDRNEVYITPTEDCGLYKLLHIVYDWNRDTDILKLDTPNGTTFEFNYNNKQFKKNGTVVGTDSNIELYDGAPVIPLIYILKEAGYTYSYDFTNKYINVTVANTFEIDTQIENGDAEGTNTTEFYSGATNPYVSIETDPYDSTNKVWQLNSTASKVWSYIRTDFVWEAGKTYTIDFDARRTGTLGDGSDHPEDSSRLVFNARYADTAGTNGVEHNPESTRVNITDEWQHFTITYTVAETLDTTAATSTHQLTFYIDPYNDLGVNYQMDNFVVRSEPIPFKLLNGNAETAETADDIADKTEGFYSGHSGNPLTIETESSGNKYWLLTSNQVNNGSYSYVRQDTTFEKGVTYYYRVRAKIGTNAAGESVPSARITLNARYYDAAKLGNTGEWYAHSYDLKDAKGNTIYFSTGSDWVTCVGSFTISQGYDSDTHGTNATEEITFYVAPYNNSGITFMFDDFEISTDPNAFVS